MTRSISEIVATPKDALRFLTMAERGDNSIAAQLARCVLGQKTVIDALTENMEKLIRRCDECEASHRKLALQVTAELTSVKRESAKQADSLTKKITKLTAQLADVRKRNRRIERAYLGK